MSNIIIPGNPVCPLCLRRMRTVLTSMAKKVYVCTQPNCMISIDARDLAVNRWNMKSPPNCAVCGHAMRAFFRAVDRYFKCQCPNCLKKGKLVQVVRGTVENLPPDGSN
jgi:hypothetical protein